MMNKLAKEIHENAKQKGFFDNEKNIGEMLCLIHSEVSEALEADRKDKYADCQPIQEMQFNAYTWENSTVSMNHAFERDIKNTFEDELADIIIRVFDLAAFKGIDIDFHVKQKMEYNSRRPHKHGKKY